MIYNEKPFDDYNNLLTHISAFAKASDPAAIISVDSDALFETISNYTNNFPYEGGAAKASTFKKAANFIVWFLAKQPIKSALLKDGTQLAGPEHNPNAVIAFDIAICILENSTLLRNNGTQVTIDKPIYLSDHSYIDTIRAFSQDNIEPSALFHFVSIFLEQLVYKTNPHCEYKASTYYPDFIDE